MGIAVLLAALGSLGTPATTARAEAEKRGPAPAGTPWRRHAIDDGFRNPDGVDVADLNGDGRPDILSGFEQGGVTCVYLHPGRNVVGEPWLEVTVGETPTVESAIFADLDGDGVLDVVSSTEGAERRVYVHWGPKPSAELLDPRAWRQDRFPALEVVTQWMFARAFEVDGRNGVDLVLGGKNDDRRVPTVVGWLESPPDPRDTAAWRWHPLDGEVSWVMSILIEDMNGDGAPDVVYTDKHGPWVGLHWLEHPGRAHALDRPWRKHTIPIEGLVGTSFAAIGDLDGDGLRDVVVSATLRADAGGPAALAAPTAPTAPTVRVDPVAIDVARPTSGPPGPPPFPTRHALVLLRKLDRSGERWRQHDIEAPADTGSPKGVSIVDVDLDGRVDLVVSCSGADGPKIGVYWLAYQESVFDPIWQAHDVSGPLGIKYDLVPLADFDGDGDLDIVSTEEEEFADRGLGVVWYENPTRPDPVARR